MATPYLQIFAGEVPSTQDLARDHLDELPVVAVATGQSRGRGRTGTVWENADSALAVSAAWRPGVDDQRPFSLMAGVAAARVLGDGVALKWPNDLVTASGKVGGILVERSGEVAVVGLGLNLHWVSPASGAAGLLDEMPDPDYHRQVAALWAAELFAIFSEEGWPLEEYRQLCSTLGREITWEPNGEGLAIGVDDQGALLVETSVGIEELHAGAVRHVTT